MLSTTAFLLLLLHCKSYASTVGQAGTPDEKEMPSKAKSTDAEGRRATKEEICYANVGCFSRHDRLTLPSNFPSNPNFFMPLFHLYSRNKRHFPTVFKLRPKGSYRHLVEFRKEKPLFILVHGWLESAYAPWAQSIKDALLVEEDSNVLVVDWSGLAATTYASAAANTAAVGRTLALVVQRLMEEFPLRAALVHAIGYSFGAQVAGFFGRNIKRNTGTLIARITALDPAGPLFNDTDVCVCPEDATFVDVIHTSGGYEHQPWQLGLLRPAGHVDFYVNGAKDQPGCFGSALCDHIRAPLLFLESLVNKACRMVSRPCRAGFAAFLRGKCVPTDAGGDRGEMGFFSPRAAGRGVQLVSTGAGPLGYFCNKERKE
ncbi:phospholipase A1 isoform X1 [Dermacentor silvarum]|uniref:phospholipase A1 isoform X1 n=1 Tax=Dermacentor silvarum TaxID=543639 RepID=UPI001897B220|nr:phospholipase A1 isoform X1 [Dermacentor silvarum]